MTDLPWYLSGAGSGSAYRFAALFLFLTAAIAAPAQETDSAASIHDWLSGELELGLNAGRSDRDGDVEIDQLLRLSVDPPKHKNLHLRATLWTIEDLDGNESSSSAFRSLNDSTGSSVATRLLRLYVELEGENVDYRVRVGRQRIMDGVAFNRIDGGYVKLNRENWSTYGFLGVRASVYSSSSHDVSTGGGFSWRPAHGTRVALDYFYGDDQRRNFGSGSIESSLTSLSIRQSLTRYHNLFARATWHEHDLDELRLTAQGVFHEDALIYTLSYRRRVSDLAERPTDFPQFFNVVGELNGYEDFQGVISFPIGGHVELGLEAQIHDAEESSFGTGNRDYQRYGLSVDVIEVAQHYDLRFILEFWEVDSGESERTVSGEVSRKWANTLAALGVDYERFQDRIIQFDLATQSSFTVESKDDIYSLYLRIRHAINERQSMYIRASVEDDDTSDAPYWRLRAQYTIQF